MKFNCEAPQPALSESKSGHQDSKSLRVQADISQGTELGTGENPLDLVREQFVGFIFGAGDQGAEVRGQHLCTVTGQPRIGDVEGGRCTMGASRQWGEVLRRPRPLLHIEMMPRHSGADAPLLM